MLDRDRRPFLPADKAATILADSRFVVAQFPKGCATTHPGITTCRARSSSAASASPPSSCRLASATSAVSCQPRPAPSIVGRGRVAGPDFVVREVPVVAEAAGRRGVPSVGLSSGGRATRPGRWGRGGVPVASSDPGGVGRAESRSALAGCPRYACRERAGAGQIEGVEIDVGHALVEADGFVCEREGECDGDVCLDQAEFVAATAIRVWRRASIEWMAAVLAAEPTAMPRSMSRRLHGGRRRRPRHMHGSRAHARAYARAGRRGPVGRGNSLQFLR